MSRRRLLRSLPETPGSAHVLELAPLASSLAHPTGCLEVHFAELSRTYAARRSKRFGSDQFQSSQPEAFGVTAYAFLPRSNPRNARGSPSPVFVAGVSSVGACERSEARRTTWPVFLTTLALAASLERP